jgi:predicted phage terminase large subunit-like protein
VARAVQGLTIRVPRTLAHQEPIAEADARFKVAANGRRWGKTFLGLIFVLLGHGPACGCGGGQPQHSHLLPGHRKYPGAVHGAKIWWVVPEFKTAAEVWRSIKWATRGALSGKLERELTVFLPTGGSVTIRSADNPDALRGYGLDGVVFDEAAKLSPIVWEEVMPPALMDRHGWAFFISTPKGTNWFHALWLQAERPGWHRWQSPSWDNRRLFPGGEQDPEIQAVRQGSQAMGPLEFAQEIEAQFVVAGRGLFKPEWERWWFSEKDAADADLYVLRFTDPETGEIRDDSYLKATCWRLQTIDLALTTKQEADWTVISTWDVTPHSDLLLVDVLRERIEGPDINALLSRSYQQWKPAKQVIEATQFQMMVVQIGVRQGLPVEAVHPDKDKVARALPATSRMKNGKVWFPKHRPEWIEPCLLELYSFPLGDHDDFTDCLAYAVREVADISEAQITAPIAVERPSTWRM